MPVLIKLFFFASCCTVAALGKEPPIFVTGADVFGTPIINGKYRDAEADALLYKTYTKDGFLEEAFEEVKNAQDDWTLLLCAIYLRVATADDCRKIRSRVLPVYLDQPDGKPTENVESVYEEKCRHWNSNILPYYLNLLTRDQLGVYLSFISSKSKGDLGATLAHIVALNKEKTAETEKAEALLLELNPKDSELALWDAILRMLYSCVQKTGKDFPEKTEAASWGISAYEALSANNAETLKALAEQNFTPLFFIVGELYEKENDYNNAAYFYYLALRHAYVNFGILKRVDVVEFRYLRCLKASGNVKEFFAARRYYDVKEEKLRNAIFSGDRTFFNFSSSDQTFPQNRIFEKRFQDSLQKHSNALFPPLNLSSHPEE